MAMTAFKIIVIVGFCIVALMALGTKDANERKHSCILTAIFGALYIAAEIVTRILP